MNKKTGELYSKFLKHVFKYIPSDGDGRLECEGMLVKLLDSAKEEYVNRFFEEIKKWVYNDVNQAGDELQIIDVSDFPQIMEAIRDKE